MPRACRTAATVAGLLSLAAAAAARPCLSVSPFRASSGADSAAVQGLRRRLLDSLRSRLGERWEVEVAGGCPADVPVLDLFQRPGDLVEADGNALLRARLEWRHAPGMVIVALEPQGRLQGDVGMWAMTLEATVRTQMLVPVQVSSDAEGATVLGDLMGSLPASGLLPPGPMRLRLQARGRVDRSVDTVLVPGLPVQLDLRLLPVPRAPEPAPRRAFSRSRWVAYGAGGLLLAGSGWFALRQSLAQDRYGNLDESSTQAQFDRRWEAVREANLWRNGLGGAALGSFGIGLFLHLREASFSW